MPNPNTTDTPANEPATDTTAELLAGFDEALANAGQIPDPPAADAVTSDEPGSDTPPVDPAAPPAEPAATGDKPAEPAAPADDKRPSDEFGELPKDAKAETRERFDKLRSGYDALHAEVAPLREALQKAGVKDAAAELPQILQRAQIGQDMVQMVTDTGATPEQYGMTLDYLGLVNKASKGDMQAAEAAYEIMTKEAAVLAKLLGREVPGIHDPLADFPDLLDAVEAGDMTKKYALEVAATRAQGAVRSHADAETARATAAQTAQTQGVTWLQQYDAQMVAADPSYAAKRPMLSALVSNIRATLPPAQWPDAVKRAYASIPAVAAPVAAPAAASKPPPGPVRPSGPRPTMVPQYDDPMAAMDAGINAAMG